MSVQFEAVEAIVVATMRHAGKHVPADTSATWEDLILWASPRRLLGRRFDVRGVGLLWDDPRQHPPEARRYDVGIPIDKEDAVDVDAPAFVTVTMPGEYLKVTHEGDYSDIGRAYEQALDVQMKIESLELVAAPILELYRNSPQEVDIDALRTDVYFPVIRL